jgi:polar amino acid transport system substrate-binding protein
MRTRLIAACLLVMSTVIQAVAQPSSTPINAAVYLSPPFVDRSGDGFLGFTWELWQQIAADLNLKYEVRRVGTVPELLTACQRQAG